MQPAIVPKRSTMSRVWTLDLKVSDENIYASWTMRCVYPHLITTDSKSEIYGFLINWVCFNCSVRAILFAIKLPINATFSCFFHLMYFLYLALVGWCDFQVEIYIRVFDKLGFLLIITLGQFFSLLSSTYLMNAIYSCFLRLIILFFFPFGSFLLAEVILRLRFLGKVLIVERANQGNLKNSNQHQHHQDQLVKGSSHPPISLLKDSSKNTNNLTHGGEPIAPRLGVDYSFPPHLEYDIISSVMESHLSCLILKKIDWFNHTLLELFRILIFPQVCIAC